MTRKASHYVAVALMLACLVLSQAPANARANQGGGNPGFGLGILLGSPTAITGKYFTAREQAWDAGLAFDLGDSFTIYGDYLRHFPAALSGRPERFLRELSPYVGIGVLFHDSDDPYVHKHHHVHSNERSTNVAVRIPLGIEWLPARFPLGVFLELVPAIFIVPRTDADFQGGLGARYYF